MDNTFKKIQEAAFFASLKHATQKRRDNKIPYIYHPLTVALIVSKLTKKEEVIIASILHDVVEDTDTLLSEIEVRFGKEVAKLVEETTVIGVSLQEIEKLNLIKIPKISKSSALIKSADFLNNLSDLNRTLKKNGPVFFNQINLSPKNKIKYYKKKLELLKKYHPNPVLKHIDSILKSILEILKY